MMAGAATVLVSLPLALYSVTGPTGTSSFNELGQAALWPLVICVFAFLRGYSTIRPTTFRTSLPILSGVFITWAAYDRWSGINDLMKSATAFPGVTVSLGVGFWLLSLGAALIVVGSVILQFVKPQHH